MTFDEWWEKNKEQYSADACHMSEYHMASLVWAEAKKDAFMTEAEFEKELRSKVSDAVRRRPDKERSLIDGFKDGVGPLIVEIASLRVEVERLNNQSKE